MRSSDLKIIGIHLGILALYAIICYQYDVLGLIELGIVALHATICSHLATLSNNKKAHWLSFFLILTIGFGVCTMLPTPIG